MIKKLVNKLTNNKSEIPLFYVTFDLNKYKEGGKKDSCNLKVHPAITDEKSVQLLELLVDHIRDNYNMDELV